MQAELRAFSAYVDEKTASFEVRGELVPITNLANEVSGRDLCSRSYEEQEQGEGYAASSCGCSALGCRKMPPTGE